MIFGVLLGTPTLRLRGDYLAIVTLGFALIIDDFVETQSGVTGGGVGSALVPPSRSAERRLLLRFSLGYVNPDARTTTSVSVPFAVGSFFIVHSRSLEHSRIGRAWVAIREDEVAAESVGINPLKYKVMAWFRRGARPWQWRKGFGGVMTAGLVVEHRSVTPGLFTVQRLGERAGIGHLRWHGFDLGRGPGGDRHPDGDQLPGQLPTRGATRSMTSSCTSVPCLPIIMMIFPAGWV